MASDSGQTGRLLRGSRQPAHALPGDWRDKLGHIRGAVLTHVCEEEGSRFPELLDAIHSQEDQRLTRRFLDEFDRYMGKDAFEAPRQMAAEIPPEQVDQSNRQPPKNRGAANC